jgi:hypothetical protein
MSGKSPLRIRPSHPIRGADRESSRTRGGMRSTRRLRLTSAADADGEIVWSWRPQLAPSSGEATSRGRRWQKSSAHRGDHVISRKPLRREGRMLSASPVCSCAHPCAILHTRPRVQRAPGFPCALLHCGGRTSAQSSGIMPRECGPVVAGSSNVSDNAQHSSHIVPG